uniref:Uncharacterized protein n=1 Tax=Helianthus annuus TaxID=4232 RepID=A0A251RME2_HELAN
MESRYSSSFSIIQIKKLNILDPDRTLFPLSTNRSSNRSYNCSHLLILLQSTGFRFVILIPSSITCSLPLIRTYAPVVCSPVSHGLSNFWCEVEEVIAEEIHASGGFAMVLGNSPPHSGSLPPFVTLCTHM